MKVGQKVVCIQGEWKNAVLFLNIIQIVFPVEGQIYTIKKIEEDVDFKRSGVGLELVETEPYNFFDSAGFRPVDESFGEKVAEILEEEFMVEPLRVPTEAELERFFEQHRFGE